MADLASVCDLTDRCPTATGAGASATLAAAQAAVLAYLNYDPRPVASCSIRHRFTSRRAASRASSGRTA